MLATVLTAALPVVLSLEALFAGAVWVVLTVGLTLVLVLLAVSVESVDPLFSACVSSSAAATCSLLSLPFGAFPLAAPSTGSRAPLIRKRRHYDQMQPHTTPNY